ncbi:hypothetical protein IAD21_00348 [Abditibacteriota bacterium]|nr:hypothetical protein IAD21_00348 [Abditibacteriota bacterium]
MRTPHLSTIRFIGPLLAPGLMLAMTLVVHAADLYVSEKGSDANPGTSVNQPLQTLQKAGALAKPGDTVWIMAGTYRNAARETGGGSSSLLSINTSGTPGAPITWRNYGNDKPELIAQGCWSAIDIKASYIVIDGLTLTGNNDNVRQIDAETNAEIDAAKTLALFEASQHKKVIDESVAPIAKLSSKEVADAVPPRPQSVQAYAPDPAFNGNGINVDCRKGPLYHHFTIRNCTIRKFGTVGISMIATDYYTLENNDVYENAWYSRYGSSGISQLGGRNLDNAPGYHNIIRNNRMWNNKCLVRVLNTDSFTDGNGIILDSLGDYSGGILIQNNLCFNNGGSGIHIFKSKAQIDVVGNTLWKNQQMWQLYEIGTHTAVNVRFYNNIVYTDRYKQVNGKPSDGVTYDYNIYYGSNMVMTKGEHDLSVDPRFVLPSTNAKVADFRLRPDSPALGTGSPKPFIPVANNLDGKPRGDRPNKGAY